ncbi:hypothetical protein HDU78_009956 [Chytriomyces hyalinus]|nr:hypothetical protein HDU78_009956 [Chytriomyces hyalinus]
MSNVLDIPSWMDNARIQEKKLAILSLVHSDGMVPKMVSKTSCGAAVGEAAPVVVAEVAGESDFDAEELATALEVGMPLDDAPVQIAAPLEAE